MRLGAAGASVAVVGIVLWGVSAAAAQMMSGCEPGRAGDPPRIVFTCAGGLVLEAEAAAAIGIVAKRDADSAVRLAEGAVFVEVPEGRRFQIRTPHAIASVRGTAFAVDVTDESTAVFVVDGMVRVGAVHRPASVILGPGQGVDVRPGEAMTVKSWGASRVAALLGRFGR